MASYKFAEKLIMAVRFPYNKSGKLQIRQKLNMARRHSTSNNSGKLQDVFNLEYFVLLSSYSLPYHYELQTNITYE